MRIVSGREVHRVFLSISLTSFGGVFKFFRYENEGKNAFQKLTRTENKMKKVSVLPFLPFAFVAFSIVLKIRTALN
jgi:hypothetical protein